MNDLVENVKISGEVYLDNLNIYEKCDIVGLRKRVGMVFQRSKSFSHVYDNIAYGPRIHGIKSRLKLNDIVEKA